jgi:hypothetical protein
MEGMMEKTISFWLVAVLAVSTLLLFAVSARAVSDEARRHLDRGQAAIEMANLNDAVKEFQEAIELDPKWPDPYYTLGMVQNRLERYDDALKNLKSYLQLAPNAKDAQEVKQLINKIEYMRDKESEVKKAFESLGTSEIHCKEVSKVNKGANGDSGMAPFSTFVRKDGELVVVNVFYDAYSDEASKRLSSGYMKGRADWRPWVPVIIKGRSFEFNYTYVVPGVLGREGGSFVSEVIGKGEIISLDPIRLKTLFTEKLPIFVTDDGVYHRQDTVYTTEIVEECRSESGS